MESMTTANGASHTSNKDRDKADGGGSGDAGDSDAGKKDPNPYDCNICLDTARDAVISMCGHLFCWPCLHTWFEAKPHNKTCPVCKAALNKDKVIPVYGRGGSSEDPRSKIPSRPQGQRTEPENNSGFPGSWGFGEGGFTMSFGIGAFPFGLFSSTFSLGDQRPPPVPRGSPHFEDDQNISFIFLGVATIFILGLIFA